MAVLKNTWENGEQWNASNQNELADEVNSKYVKPAGGVPITDMAASVQISLGKADTAVQAVASTDITDSTSTGRAVLKAADASVARTAIGVAYGTTAGTVTQGNDARLSPSSTSITDATATGRSLLTATDESSARAAIGVAYGTAAGTVVQGNDSRVTGAEQTSAKGVANGYASLDANTRIPVAQIPTSVVANTPRASSTASAAIPSVNVEATDVFSITALAVAITSVTVTGTPQDNQRLLFRIKDNGTTRQITWGSSFASSGIAIPISATVANKTHLVGFIFDSAVSKWVCVASDSSGY